MKTNGNIQYDKQRIYSINILEAARHLGLSLHPSGVNQVAVCPWHEDKHPSLVFYHRTDQNHCHCYACGHHDTVVGLTMKVLNTDYLGACQWLSAEFGIPTLESKSFVPYYRPIISKPSVKEEATEYTYIPMEMVDELVSTENSLCHCLMQLFHPEAVKWVAEEYRIGSYAFNNLDDYTVFPNIDYVGRVHNLKIKHYDCNPKSPKFTHSDQTPYLLGKMWAKSGKLPGNAKFSSACLFGEHLLSKYPTQKVVLVESPKNAIVGALANMELLWLATGNKTSLKRNRMIALQGRDVIIIPDRDAINLWKKDIVSMSDIANFTVRPFSLLTGTASDLHYDVADYIIEQRLKALKGDFQG